DPDRLERLRLRCVRRRSRPCWCARAARAVPRVRVPRNAHRAPCADHVPSAAGGRALVHRCAANARHRRRKSPADTAHRHHPPVRGVRRILARDELDGRGTADASVPGVEPDAGRGTGMTSPISSNIRSLTFALALAFLVTSIGAAYWTVLASDQL